VTAVAAVGAMTTDAVAIAAQALEGLDAFGAEALQLATGLGLLMLSMALVLASVRLFIGPSLPDRIVGLELIASLFVGVVAITSIVADVSVFLDVAIALTLVAFLGAVVFARFIEQRVGR
jgi:multicomponent Na+:H+ antiporter subunit F